MSNWKITIEGSGPCLDDTEDAADQGAKMLVEALKVRGHKIHRAEFSGKGKLPSDINVEVRYEAPADEPIAEVVTDQPGSPLPESTLADSGDASSGE